MALFKMNPKSPMMKALVGNQHKLPEHLKKAIKASPAKKATDKNRKELGRDGKDVVISEKESTVRRRDNKNSGARDFEQVTQTVEKGSRAERGTTMSDRQGGGRMGKKTYQRVKGQKGKYTMVGSDIAGTKTKGGRTQYRKLKDGSKVVVEASLKERGEAPKTRGIKSAKIKTTGSTEDLKKKSPAKKRGVKNLKSPVKKNGVKALKSPAKKYGKSPAKKYNCKK